MADDYSPSYLAHFFIEEERAYVPKSKGNRAKQVIEILQKKHCKLQNEKIEISRALVALDGQALTGMRAPKSMPFNWNELASHLEKINSKMYYFIYYRYSVK